MSFLVLLNPPKAEFDYQALDYCKLFDALVEEGIASDDKVKEYLGDLKTIDLKKARGLTILCFRALTVQEVDEMREDNKLIFFSDGDIPPSTVLAANIIDFFVAFGSRSAYKLANKLKSLNIGKPVYKINPWVNVEGIKKYESPPMGKVSGTGDMGLRSVIRLMAAGAVVVVPNQSPFTDVVTDRFNGLVYKKDTITLDNDALVEMGSLLPASEAQGIAARAMEFAKIYSDTDHYKALFDSVIDGHGLDHNEPWIRVETEGGARWIIPKETMVSGDYVVVPPSHDEAFRTLKVLSLVQLLDYFSRMRFKDAYVFDVLLEELDEHALGRVNRFLSILGERAKNIFFCLEEVPEEWSGISQKLAFMPVSEALKQIS
jgi:hypothetical protein